MIQEGYEIAGSSEETLEQLRTQGYANLEFGLGRPACEELFTGFKHLVALTEEPGGDKIVDALTFTRTTYGNSKYELDLRIPEAEDKENPERKVRDHKYVFHFGPTTRAEATKALGPLPKQIDEYLEQCATFYDEGLRTATIGATALGIKDLLFHPSDPTRNIHHLRLLDYISTENPALAEPHFDRGVVTLAISESHPGLRGAAVDNGYLKPLTPEDSQKLRNLQPISHVEHVAKFFGSAGLRRTSLLDRQTRSSDASELILDLDALPLLAHDAVNEQPGVNRQAVVMFLNPHLDTYYHPLPERLPEESKHSKIFYFVPTAAETKILTD